MKPVNIDNRLVIGALGEEIACRYLIGRGFRIVTRNYREKCGEIDIIAEKGGILHFLEVKSVSREKYQYGSHETDVPVIHGVNHETFGDSYISNSHTAGSSRKKIGRNRPSKDVSRCGHRPEDNMHGRKLQRMKRAIQMYLLKHHVSYETPFQIDGMTVYLDHDRQQATVSLIENINL